MGQKGFQRALKATIRYYPREDARRRTHFHCQLSVLQLLQAK